MSRSNTSDFNLIGLGSSLMTLLGTVKLGFFTAELEDPCTVASSSEKPPHSGPQSTWPWTMHSKIHPWRTTERRYNLATPWRRLFEPTSSFESRRIQLNHCPCRPFVRIHDDNDFGLFRLCAHYKGRLAKVRPRRHPRVLLTFAAFRLVSRR